MADTQPGTVWERQSGPPLQVTVMGESSEHPGWVDCRMMLNGRSFGVRPMPAELLDGKHFARVELEVPFV